MRTHLRAAAAALALQAASGPASAWEVLVGLGADDVPPSKDGDVAPVAALEARTEPLVDLWGARLALGAAGRIDAQGEAWAGAGPVLMVETALFGARIEASFMPGLYAAGDADDDLGGPIEFRSALGLSLPVAAGWRVGAQLSHTSNAGLYAENPGVETLLATVSRRF